MDLALKILATLAAVVAVNIVFIWLAALLLLRDHRIGNAVASAVFQILLWIPVALAILVLSIPLAGTVEFPRNVGDLAPHIAPILAAVFASGMFGVKWGYERKLRITVFTYGLALALQAGAYVVFARKVPEFWQWLPNLDNL